MRNVNITQKTVTSALEELGAELGISEADFGGKVNVRNAVCNLAAPQVELSEFKLGPRFSGDPNGASKLDWSMFTRESPARPGEK
jgi:hypothetical protein